MVEKYPEVELEEVNCDDLKDGDQIAVRGNVKELSRWLLLVTAHSNGTYLHHGICSDGGKYVYDFSGASKEDAKPQKRHFNKFFSGRSELYRVVYKDIQCLKVEETLQMAKNAVDSAHLWPKYNVILNNCESFATFLKTGELVSKQALQSWAEAKVVIEAAAAASVRVVKKLSDM